MQYPILNGLYAYGIVTHSDLATNERIVKIIPNSENWCDIGTHYRNKKQFNLAKKYYQDAAYMVPTRFKPNYLLWEMCVEQGEKRETIELAEKLISMPLKVENTYTLRSKGRIRSFLNNM